MGSGFWQFRPAWGWFCPLTHKRARPRSVTRSRGLSAISMVLSAATLGGWFRDAVGTGECPEWQRELTVNQPSYDFAGSSPASPTSLRSLRELRLGKPSPLQSKRAKAVAP